MKIKELIDELKKYDEELDVDIYRVYRTKRIEKFDAKRVIPCKKKATDEITKVTIII